MGGTFTRNYSFGVSLKTSMKAHTAELRKQTVHRGRVLLRPFEWADCAALTRWGKHTDPLYTLYNRPSQMNDWYERFYKAGQQSDSMRFAVENEQNQLVGYITLFKIDARNHRAMMGINFDVNYLSQGYGTEAIQALLHLYFAHEFKELWLEVVAFNHRAIRCYYKCGFEIVSEVWDAHSERCSLDIYTDERYASVRDFFRYSSNRLEVLKYIMVARQRTENRGIPLFNQE